MKRAIIIDDERLARAELRKLLLDYPEIEVVDEAANVEEGLDKIDQHSPDIIFLDINMPGKSGINLLKDIRNADWPGKVIMLTNSSETFYRQRCLLLGASFFLDKTADFEKVPLILNGIL